MTETTKINYKKTLNLPKTDFPMRAGLTQNEPQSQKRWEQMKLYDTALAQRANAEPFVFHDGPPYANGLMHTGHLLNKVLKDFVVRTRLMSGKHCAYVPGWDCHGLPIEHMVMTELFASGKIKKLNQLDEDTRRMAVRRECAKYAQKYQKLQTVQMQRLLTLADYEHPYLTMTGDYEKAVLEVFADLVEQGPRFAAGRCQTVANLDVGHANRQTVTPQGSYRRLETAGGDLGYRSARQDQASGSPIHLAQAGVGDDDVVGEGGGQPSVSLTGPSGG